MDSSKVNQCIEALCKCGCEAVRATITSMEMGAELEQTRDLDEQEAAIVLDELKAIMAVYDDRQ
jgi:4-hydroxy-3-methylbut-2-en-1-yl diphosphate synthase IspG/GcpE